MGTKKETEAVQNGYRNDTKQIQNGYRMDTEREREPLWNENRTQSVKRSLLGFFYLVV